MTPHTHYIRRNIYPDDIPDGDELSFVEYQETGLGDAQLDITYVTQPARDQRRPAMIFVHGGGWRGGTKKQFYRQSAILARTLNVFCVNVKYRLLGEAKYPAAIHDCKAVIRWLRSVADEQHIDVNKIGIAGGSAGAHIAAMVATTNKNAAFEGSGPYQNYSSDVQLAVLFNGHYDMNDQLKDHVQDAAMHDFFGGHPWEIPEIYGSASPFLRANKLTPPTLFLHGDQDSYPHRQSVAMHERLLHYGAHSEIEIYAGKPHAWFNTEPDFTITTARMQRFIAEQFAIKPA